MSGCKDDVRFGAEFHHPDHFGEDAPPGIQHRDSGAGQFVAPVLVRRRKGRHPDTAAEGTGRFERLLRRKDVDLVAVDAIHAETAEHLELRHSPPDQVSPVMTAPVVRFVHQRPISGLFRLFGERQLIDTARPGIRMTVDVDVAHSGQQRVDGTFTPEFRLVPAGDAGRSADQHHPSGDTESLDELPPVHGYTLFPS